MKKLLTLGIGAVLVLAPTSAAVAGPSPHATGEGNAHGNCRHSSATGDHAPLPGSAGNGNGGHRKGETCGPADGTDGTDGTGGTDGDANDGGDSDIG